MFFKTGVAENKKVVLIVALIVAVGIFHCKLKKKPAEEGTDLFSAMKSFQYNWKDKTAPDFKLNLLNGENFSVSDVVGKKIIVLNFFATWCEPCKEELPELNAFYNQYRDNLAMVGIASEESEDKIINFISENKIFFPVGIDTGGTLAQRYGVGAIPTTVLIGPLGKILFYETGAINNTMVTLEPVYKTSVNFLKSGAGISKEDYLKEEKLGRKDFPAYGGDFSIEDEKVNLTEREEAIAKQIYCPRGCGKNLIDCDCSLCKKAVEEIREEIKKNKSDKEIVKTINTRYCKEK